MYTQENIHIRHGLNTGHEKRIETFLVNGYDSKTNQVYEVNKYLIIFISYFICLYYVYFYIESYVCYFSIIVSYILSDLI